MELRFGAELAGESLTVPAPSAPLPFPSQPVAAPNAWHNRIALSIVCFSAPFLGVSRRRFHRLKKRAADRLRAEISGIVRRLAASPVALRAAADACPDSDPLEGP